MKVLLLTPVPTFLTEALDSMGDSYVVSMEPPHLWPTDIDFIVSFGYRHIIPASYLDQYDGRAINIHLSLLPWNRGADPNFWSWFDRTPKGVSIHQIDEGIDTGDIIAQLHIDKWAEGHTLRSSYAELITHASLLFALHWQSIRDSWPWVHRTVYGYGGSYHRMKDKERWWGKLSAGWDTPVAEVEELGAASKGN